MTSQNARVLKPYNYCPICRTELSQDDLGYNACTETACTFIHYENPTPVVAAIVEYGHEQIVLAHNKLWPPKWYGLITGFVEKHEAPHDTVLREVEEELGLKGSLEQFIGHYTFKKMNQLIIAYHVKADGPIALNDELDDYRLVSFAKAKYWPAGTGYALKDFLEGRGFSPEMLPFS